MKKRINDRIYDTTTAKMIWQSEWANPISRIYRKRNGEYFVHESYLFNAPEVIRPLMEAQAKRIMEDECYLCYKTCDRDAHIYRVFQNHKDANSFVGSLKEQGRKMKFKFISVKEYQDENVDFGW